MVRLILARHGETAWNAQKRYQGQADVELSETGRRQAASLARRLAQEEIHAIAASDLQRAWETAQAIAAPHGLSVRAEPRLREINFGDWEGLTYGEIQKRDPQALAAWEADPFHVPPPGGETLAQVAARVQSALDDVTRSHQDQTVLLVAHGGPLRILLCLALGLAPRTQWQFRLDTAAISELEIYDGGAILNYLNDTKHLAGKAQRGRGGGRLILILGGARSGKSSYAEKMATQFGDRVLYVATAQAGDEEMRARIAAHRQARPANWRTVEAPTGVGEAVRAALTTEPADAVLLDCLTLLVSNVILQGTSEDDLDNVDEAAAWERVEAELDGILDACRAGDTYWIVVSNEVGWGLVPPYPLGRVYRDLLGRANQRLAARADQVYLMVAGLPVDVRALTCSR